MKTSFPFNTDLLLTDEDRRAALTRFPNIYFALDDAELREAFLHYDRQANAAKRESRKWGIISVALVAVALMISSADPLYRESPAPWPQILNIVAALSGVGGAVIAYFGVMFADSKNQWLETRYCAERLRQLHFQTLVFRAGQILGGDQQRAAFLAARAADLTRLKDTVLKNASARFGAIIDDDPERETWLVKEPPHEQALDPAHVAEYFTALEDLRIGHQIDFTTLKLRDSGVPLAAAPRRQVAMFSAIALWCVIGMLLLHLAHMLGVIDAAILRPDIVPVGTLWLAILALSARTLEEGLHSNGEVERYRHYVSSVKTEAEHFTTASDPLEKLRVLREIEELAYEEMVNFLKSYHEARFVM